MEELIKRAEEKGINVEDLIIAAIAVKDPKESLKVRMELAEKYLNEVKEYLKKGDPVQASEKAYKVAEEVVKALAEKYNINEYQQFIKDRWYIYTLGKAVNTLAHIVGDWIISGWSSAYYLHVWGFHEMKLGVEDIKSYVETVRKMFEECERILMKELS
ncbi:MAG: PaREP1 family protein [Candidatus Aramenus sp.]|nr:PaREP1 family protein [Candidatus Aramenus sp.]